MPINLVIPAAGLGSRFRVTGVSTPKPLICIEGLPMICWVIGNFQLQAEDKIFIISRSADELPKSLSKFLGKFRENVEYIEIDELTDGAATTLELGLSQISTEYPVLSVNSDQYISADLSSFMNLVRSGGCAGQILLMSAKGDKWSYVERDTYGKIINVVEKIQVSDEATVGVYGWRNAQTALGAIKAMKRQNFRVNGEFYVAPAYNYLDEKDNEIVSSNIGDIRTEVHGLGTPEDLEIFIANPNIKMFVEKVFKNLGI
jgi:NDP-sugar pyrophosphorylase family protein